MPRAQAGHLLPEDAQHPLALGERFGVDGLRFTGHGGAHAATPGRLASTGQVAA